MRGTGEADMQKSVPIFALGLSILLVDHDASSLASIASMLQRYSYNVTTAPSTTAAMSMVWGDRDRFKLIMAHLNLARTEDLSFLRGLVKAGLPVILISSSNDVNSAEKALDEGACFFLEKPIALSDLKYVWQHACQRRMKNPVGEERTARMKRKRKHTMAPPPANLNSNNKTHTVLKGKTKQISAAAEGSHSKNVQQSSIGGLEGRKAEPSRSEKATKRPLDSENDCRATVHSKLNTGAQKVDSGKQKVIEQAKEVGNINGEVTAEKRSRIVWTSELHHKFIASVSALGEAGARPKPILKMMNVPHLTHRQVASHLQKYKAQVQQLCRVGTTGSPSPKRQIESFTRSGALGMGSFGYERRANATPYLPPSDPFRIREFDNFLYGDLQRRDTLVQPMEPSHLNHTPCTYENSASALYCGGSNSVSGDVSDKQCASEAEGIKIRCPELDLPNTSSPLEAEGDMDYFLDLASILSPIQPSTEFIMDYGPQYELSVMQMEQLPTLSAANSTQNVTEYSSNLASEAIVQDDLSGENSMGYLMNSSSSTSSDDFLMAFKDENSVQNTIGDDELLKMFEEEPRDLTDLQGQLNFDNLNQCSEWLEELLQAPSEAKIGFQLMHLLKM